MKTFTKTLAILAVTAAFSANAAIDAADTNSTQFVVGGTVAELCKVNSTELNTNSLDLTTTNAQDAATVNVWCNNGTSSNTTTFTSENNGVLVSNDTNETIAYSLTYGGQAIQLGVGASFSSGTGVNGATEDRTVQIAAAVTGLEDAGAYSDTITVTVAPN